MRGVAPRSQAFEIHHLNDRGPGLRPSRVKGGGAWRALARALLVALALAPARSHAAAPTLMRFANASATDITFVARNALWTVPLAGGTARRLADGAGGILAPRFSPDGRLIAFTRRHAGGYDVFVVPAAGGLARRLTFDAPRILGENLVVTWTPDGRHVVFLSKRASPMFRIDRAFAVPATGGLAEPLALGRAGLLSYAPDGHAIALNRVFRNFDTRKRYLGGQHQNVFVDDVASGRLSRLTDWKGTDTSPMWFGRTIYILSDRDRHFRANIWAIDPVTKAARQITHFADFDIDAPSLGARTICFQQGGHLWAIDLPSERLRNIRVTVPDDGANTALRTRAVGGQARVDDATGGIDYALSPDGKAVLLSAHGDIVRVGAEGRADDLTNTPGADEDHPSWSPDGRTIAYETDRNGEQELAIRAASGGPERLITRFARGIRETALWSPGGDVLAVPDIGHALWLVPTDGGAPRLVARDPHAEIRDASFSPDGHWLAYSETGFGGQRAIHLHEIASGRDVAVSDAMQSDRNPVFSPDGRFLLFVSRRHAQALVSDRDDTTLATLSSDGIYAATLDRRERAPLSGPARGGAADGDPAPGTPAPPFRIDLDGLASRTVALPVAPASIPTLAMRGAHVFYEASPPVLLDGGTLGGRPTLHVLDLADGSDRVVAGGLDGYSLSADGARVLFHRDGAWHLAPTGAGTDLAPTGAGTNTGTTLDLSNVRVAVDPRREWTEMFDQAWRLDRDVFFSAAMNGDDWQAVHDAYARLMPFVGSEDDFRYVLGEMHGELASSHARLAPARQDDDGARPDHPAHLGADLVLDPASGRYRIAHIYRGDDTRPDTRGPLAEPGLDIAEGDLLLAIDGRTLRAPTDPDRLLLDGGDTMTLTLARRPDGPTRDVVVHPIPDEMPLRHHDWIEQARARVAALSDGRLGYVYLSDFDAEGAADFARQFPPQADRPGLVIDIRWNRGGFLSQAVLAVLRRTELGLFVNREGGLTALPSVTPPKVLVTLIDEGTASDGDQFAFFFRRLGLGPLVGTRTWGGVQGIDGPWPLMDGTALTIPKDSLADLDAHWVIENVGVAPDIAVDDEPDDFTNGRDAQLDRAVAVGLAALRRNPPTPLRAPPPRPAYPAAGNVPGASFTAP